MPSSHIHRGLAAVLLVLAVAAVAGCATNPVVPDGGPDAEGPAVGAPPTQVPTPTHDDLPAAPPDVAAIVASWDPAAPPTDLGGGFVLADCEGDAPTLCVVDADGEAVHGVIEELRYAAPAELAGLEGPDLDAALRDFAAARTADVAADRAAGCGPGHEVLPDAPGSLLVDGAPGLRYGFAAVVDGEVVERVATWATVRGDELRLVVAAAVAPGACMDDGLTAFTPDVLADLLPTLDRVVAGTPLPT